MRVIEFRAVSQLDGNWVYGSLIKYDYERPNMEDLSKPHIQSSYDICRKENDWCFSYKNVPVFEETIGQYTGLTDKNGTKIFEGDILLVGGTQKVVVSFEDGQFVISHYAINLLRDRTLESEVVGNIHDNPEFLEEV